MNKQTFNQLVNKFQTTRDHHHNSLNMHALLIQKEGKYWVHRFNERREMSDVRSISKTVLTLVAGIVHKLSNEGKYPRFHEETFIYPIIKNVIHLKNEQNLPYLKQVQVKHLFTHTVGYDEVLLMRQDIAHIDPYRYVELLINHPIVHKPGEYYLYSNAGFYLLSVVLQEFLQEDLLTFIDRELFSPLHIHEYKWEKYGDYLAGATRLWLFPEDLLKIGEVLLHKGIFNGQQLLPNDWVDHMISTPIRTKEVDTPGRIFRRYAYGYGIWLAKEQNIFFGHGTDGQTLVILPEKEMIILTQAEQVDMEPIEEIINQVMIEEG